MTLEIVGQAGRVIRRYSSADKPEVPNLADEAKLAYPTYWLRPPRLLPNKAGMQRWVWDLRYAPPEGFPRSYPIAAIYRDTPPQPEGPLASPGEYQLRLTVDGRSFTERLVVKVDPRVTTPPDALARNHELAMRCYDGISRVRAVQADVRKLRTQLQALQSKAGAIADAVAALDQKVAAIEGASGGGFGPRGGGSGLGRLASEFLSVMNLVDNNDLPHTMQAAAAVSALQRLLAEMIGQWDDVRNKEIKSLNEQLRRANLTELSQ